ncbi:MAG: TlpA family protein disulfide reductase [Acidobacteriia bacterium]|nr:TlpA family protein disulfide reductase [Terriglobia bacterium]
MNGRAAVRTALAACLLLMPTLATGQPDAETRVLNYVRDHLQPGQPLVVTDLYNKVFTQPDERRALEKLYSAFFRIPLFVAQYQKRYGRPPRLNEIAEQFSLHNAAGADILLRVMESDPRVPRFLSRDSKTGEITKVDVAMIEGDERFGKILEHQLGGWEGRPAPDFNLPRLDGGEINSAALHGEVALLYVWFTGCPPCMKEAPDLVKLFRTFSGQGFQVIGANADDFLGLAYDDAARRGYIQKEGITFPVVRWTRESNQAYGGIAIYPTLFLIDRKGLVTSHWIGYVQPEELRRAISKTLQAK